MKEYTSLDHKYFCHDCDWQVLHVCVNGDFRTYKDAADWDWWLYCTNKVCKNHDGEGMFQSAPDWVYFLDNVSDT